MNADDWQIFLWIVGGLATGGILIAGFLTMRIDKLEKGHGARIDAAHERLKDSAVDRANMRTDMATLRANILENHPNKAEIQHSLAGIHGRIDDVVETVNGRIDDAMETVNGRMDELNQNMKAGFADMKADLRDHRKGKA